MRNRSSLFRILLVLIPLSLGALTACQSPQNIAGPELDTNLKLIVGHQETATFVTINNNFDNANPSAHWNGLLIQLGAYEKNPKPPDALFGSVIFEKGGKIIETLSAAQFGWINIIAKRQGAGPIKASQEYHLRPNKKSGPNECEPLNNCVGKACICEDPSDPNCVDRAILNEQCIRSKNLHRYFETKVIVTYWQGDKGYQAMIINPPLEPDGSKIIDDPKNHHYSYNRYEFTFLDEAVIEVYSEDERPRTKKYQPGEIDTIKINWLPPATNHGMHQDPPWRLP